MINEDEINRRASEELFSTMQSIYNPGLSKTSRLDQERIELKKRLMQIDIEDGKTERIEMEQKKEIERRRMAWKRQQGELRTNQEMIDMQFAQMTGQGGTYPFKNKK